MSKPIKLTKVFEVPIEAVWKALTDPEAMSEWLMPCNFVPEVGHEFQFKTRSAIGFNGVVSCTVLDIKDKELLSFSWSGGPLKNTTVTFRLSDENGHTRLELEHTGFTNSLSNLIVRKMLSNGWKKIIMVRLLQNLNPTWMYSRP